MSEDTNTSAPERGGAGMLPHLAMRVFNTPLLIAEDKLQAVLWVLSSRMNIDVDQPDADSAVMQPAASVGRWENYDRARNSGLLIERGVGILSITASLVNRGKWIGASSGLQSYDGIAQQLRMAADDERVRSILLDLNSYGGEAAGTAELAQEIREISAVKPVTALVADAAASAAYWIASAADEVVVTETGMVGSIGVVLTHQDLTGAAEKAGVKVTHIHAGSQKLVGNPFKSLTSSDREQLQAEVDKLYDLFTSRVAAYRQIPVDAVRKTEARVYRGADAVAAGLADRVMSGRALLAELQDRAIRGERRTKPGDKQMSKTTTQGGAETAQSATEEQIAAARTEGAKAGATAERARCKAILTHPEAKGREKLAAHLAFETDMSAESAGGMLVNAERANTAPAQVDAAAALNNAMAGAAVVKPDADAGAEGAGKGTTGAVIDGQGIFAARAKASKRN